MSAFNEYSNKYQSIRMRREDGILEMQFHTEGGPLKWGLVPHRELEEAFLDAGRDNENHVIILTGTGDEYCGPVVAPGRRPALESISPAAYDRIYWEGKRLLTNLLDIEVPVISALNGPAVRHAEIPLLSDIVLASETAVFQDSAHFSGGMVPGDGVHIVFLMLMGINRGRYFLLTGQSISAHEALSLGLVNEVLPQADVLPRAWQHARMLLERPPLVRRYARVLVTQELKRRMHDLLGYGLALEGLALMRQ